MLKVRLITVGKLKEQYLRDACAEYAKRIGRFASLQIIELEESRLSDKPSRSEIDKALAKESEAILRVCEGYVIALCIEGKQRTSEEFSAMIQEIGVRGQGTVSLIIGSSYGLADTVKSRADVKFSMSKLTFPHQLARVMLLEQIYRAFMISGGGQYHK